MNFFFIILMCRESKRYLLGGQKCIFVDWETKNMPCMSISHEYNFFYRLLRNFIHFLWILASDVIMDVRNHICGRFWDSADARWSRSSFRLFWYETFIHFASVGPQTKITVTCREKRQQQPLPPPPRRRRASDCNSRSTGLWKKNITRDTGTLSSKHRGAWRHVLTQKDYIY